MHNCIARFTVGVAWCIYVAAPLFLSLLFFLLFSGALLFRMAGRLNFVRARSAEVFEEYQIRPYVINVDT